MLIPLWELLAVLFGVSLNSHNHPVVAGTIQGGSMIFPALQIREQSLKS